MYPKINATAGPERFLPDPSRLSRHRANNDNECGKELEYAAARVLFSLRYDGGFRDPLIEQIALNIRAEMLAPTPAGKMLVENLTSALGVHVLRHHSNLESARISPPGVRGALDPQRLRRVKDFIECNLGRNLTIETMAKEACLSPFHFARAFKAATGLAPHRYITELRIERAKSWIAKGRPLAAIAYDLGFSSQAHFTKRFKQLVGATPGAYRERRP
ncbi:MAG: AraC family transcriptional regulator [Acidobacteriota bacterium]|nr:AraC family transcriptional regulator [Acidobacteriota bacterium]